MPNKKKEDYIMWVLKTNSIKIPLYDTPKGLLQLQRNKDEDTYTFMLDSVILNKEEQKELSKLWGIN